MKALLLIITLLSSFPLLAELEKVEHYVQIARPILNHRRVNTRLRACTNKYFQSAIMAMNPEKSVTETRWVLDNCPKININQEMYDIYQPNIYAVYNWTPLFSAIHREQVELVNLLIDRKANLNATTNFVYGGGDNSYFSCLIYAIGNVRHTEIALALIKGGANVNMRVSQRLFDNKPTKSPLGEAILVKNKKVEEALRAAGASASTSTSAGKDEYNYHEDDQNRP